VRINQEIPIATIWYLNMDCQVRTPIELQHGTADYSVPVELSLRLKEELEIVNIFNNDSIF